MAAKTITQMFYGLGGYISSSASSGFSHYISVDDVTGTYVPFAVAEFNKLCSGIHTVSVTSQTSGDIYDDRIVAELALSLADRDYDKIHVDPDLGRAVNRHEDSARMLILNAYGVRDKFGRLVYPVHSDEARAYHSGVKQTDVY